MSDNTPDLTAAATFLDLNARLIDRQRFAHLFRDGPREGVVAAVRAYRNPDGGFGNALEPDLRDCASQTAATTVALETLAEAGAFDDPMVAPALDFIAGIALPDGPVPFVLESALDHPRAPWWVPDGSPSVIQTGALTSLLHEQGRDHPWLGPATEWMWQVAERAEFGHPYEARFAMAFLDHVPDAERAERALQGLGAAIERGELVELDPDAPGETHGPVDFSPWPGARSRALFDDALIDRHLDALARGQQEDGGWTFDWLDWAPGPSLEWRGVVTVHALKVLRANGRLSG